MNKQKMNKHEENIFETLIQGEMSAIETYNQVLDKLDSPAEISKLQTISKNHKDALKQLKVYADYKGADIPKDSGYWGVFTKGVTGTAKLFGETAAVKALKEGEKHGLKEYNDAIASDELSVVAKNFIRDNFIPNMELHINTLDAIMKN